MRRGERIGLRQKKYVVMHFYQREVFFYQSYYLAPLPDSDCCFSPACSSCVHFSHDVTWMLTLQRVL